MKPAPFDFHAPNTVEEATGLLAQYGYDAKVLAGGQSLIPAMNFRLAQPAVLIDLNRIEQLAYIRPGPDGGVSIGAMTRHSAIEHAPLVAQRLPLLGEVAPNIAHVQIRNRGTFGGSMAHADPAGHWPVAAAALGARIRIQGRAGERWVEVDDFFLGLYTTALQPDEILVEVALPPGPPRTGSSYKQVARQHGAFPLAGAAAVVTMGEDDRCERARLVILGAGDRPMVALEAARALSGQEPTPAALAAAADAVARFDIDPGSDIHASAAYRRHLVRVLAQKALTDAFQRAH